jgi:peroxiredoxin
VSGARATAVAAMACAALWLLLGAPPASSQERERRPLVPDFEATSLGGETVRLSALRGRVVVVSFWATWCAPCLLELPFLQGFYEELGDEGLTVVAVAMDGPETQSQVRREVRRSGLTMPVILDTDGTITSVLNPRAAAPFTLFIDRRGGRAHVQEGYASGDELHYRVRLDALLAEDGLAEEGSGQEGPDAPP